MDNPEFVAIGKIMSTWGRDGKLQIAVETDFPERFSPSSKVFIEQQPMTIESVNWHRGRAIVKLNAVNSLEDAEKLVGQLLEIHHSQLYSLPKGKYYQFQLIGLAVVTTQGELLGEITDILNTGSNDNYVVAGANGDILIPAIGDVVKSIDLDKGQMLIEPMDGLLNLNEKATG